MTRERKVTQFKVLTELAHELVSSNPEVGQYLRTRGPGQLLDGVMIACYMDRIRGMTIYFDVGTEGAAFSGIGKDLFNFCYRKAIEAVGRKDVSVPDVASEKIVPAAAVSPAVFTYRSADAPPAAPEPPPVRKGLPEVEGLDEKQYGDYVALIRSLGAGDISYFRKCWPGKQFNRKEMKKYGKSIERLPRYFCKGSFTELGKSVFEAELDLINSKPDDAVTDWKRSQGIWF